VEALKACCHTCYTSIFAFHMDDYVQVYCSIPSNFLQVLFTFVFSSTYFCQEQSAFMNPFQLDFVLVSST